MSTSSRLRQRPGRDDHRPSDHPETPGAPADEPAPVTPTRIRRRDLLAWGGAAALLPAFPGIARAQAPAAAPTVLQGLSVGFVAGSETWRHYRKLSLARLSRGYRAEAGVPLVEHSVVPAVGLIAGDQTLANELVRVGIRGLYPVPTSDLIRSIRLTVLFPNPDPRRRPLPFHAWSYEGRPAPSPSPPLEFVAPLTVDGGFRLQLDVLPAAGSQRSRRLVDSLTQERPGGSFATEFTVDWFEGRPKLQRGVYLLGLAPGTWNGERTLPIQSRGRQRPLELLSVIVTFDRVEAE